MQCHHDCVLLYAVFSWHNVLTHNAPKPTMLSFQKLLQHNIRWPPYRIDNLTSHTIRLRQQQGHTASDTSSSTLLPNSSSVSAAVKSISIYGFDHVDSNTPQPPPWDVLAGQTSLAYAWDHPEGSSNSSSSSSIGSSSSASAGIGGSSSSSSRALKVAFKQGNMWVEREFKLDEFAEHK
jgi:hypothetical protein